MIFNIDRAQAIWRFLQERERHGYTDEMQVQYLWDCLQQACKMGYGAAMDDVRSTPWEWKYACLNIEALNEISAQGWDFVSVAGGETPVFIFRRRKAVSDGEVKQSS